MAKKGTPKSPAGKGKKHPNFLVFLVGHRFEPNPKDSFLPVIRRLHTRHNKQSPKRPTSSEAKAPEDELRRKTKGYLPECDVAFIDEIFKVRPEAGERVFFFWCEGGPKRVGRAKSYRFVVEKR